MQRIYRRSPMLKCDFNKVAFQLYWNCTSAWLFSCKFAAYFSNFIEIALQHGCSPLNLLHISRTPFPKNTSGGLLLTIVNLELFITIYIRHRQKPLTLGNPCNFMKKRSHHRCFPVNIAKCFKTPISKNICEQRAVSPWCSLSQEAGSVEILYRLSIFTKV